MATKAPASKTPRARRPAQQPGPGRGLPEYGAVSRPVPPGSLGEDPENALDPGTFEFEPISLSSNDKPDEGVRITLFLIDGKPYTIPSQPRGNLATAFIRMARLRNEVIAQDWLMAQLLGEEGWEAFCNFKGRITNEDVAKMYAIVTRITLGALETPKDDDD